MFHTIENARRCRRCDRSHVRDTCHHSKRGIQGKMLRRGVAGQMMRSKAPAPHAPAHPSPITQGNAWTPVDAGHLAQRMELPK